MIAVENEKQLSILRKFQEQVADLNQDEITCIRFLISRDFNANLAEEMLRNHLKWRIEVNIGAILAEDYLPPDMINDFPFKYVGKSKFGGPTYWLPLGTWKARYHIERGRRDDCIKFGYRLFDNMLKNVRASENRRTTVIACLEELTYSKFSNYETLSTLYAGIQTLQLNYPETIQHIVVINAPAVFSVVFNFVRPILTARSLGKFSIHGRNKCEWLPRLRELCDDSIIPSQYLV